LRADRTAVHPTHLHGERGGYLMTGKHGTDRERTGRDSGPAPHEAEGAAHRRTYGAFMRFVGYGLAAVALVLILLAIFLV